MRKLIQLFISTYLSSDKNQIFIRAGTFGLPRFQLSSATLRWRLARPETLVPKSFFGGDSPDYQVRVSYLQIFNNCRCNSVMTEKACHNWPPRPDLLVTNGTSSLFIEQA